MPGSGKPGNHRQVFHPSHSPWKSRTLREIPTFPQPRLFPNGPQNRERKPGEADSMQAMEKWKSKSRIPTFPQPAVLPAAQGRNQFKKRSYESRKDAPAALSRPPLSGSSCIGNELRFQDHSSIGKCYLNSLFPRDFARREQQDGRDTGIRGESQLPWVRADSRLGFFLANPLKREIGGGLSVRSPRRRQWEGIPVRTRVSGNR